MKKIILFFSMHFVLISMNVHSQALGDITQTPQVFLPTPQTQIFEKYVTHAVTEYNGLPEINIPLYTIEVKGLKIPISLSYYAGGVKYKKYDGDIAAGWSINAGGYRVSRTIYGKPDELYPFYNHNTLDSYQLLEKSGYLASISLEYAQALPMLAINSDLTIRDGEFDQFTYMLPSSGGQFVVSDRTSKAIGMANAKQDQILLDPDVSGLVMDNIKIIDNSGFEYYAGGVQNGTALVEKSRANNYYKTAWPVWKIQSPYNEQVLFDYSKVSVDMADENYYTYTINDATSFYPYPASDPAYMTTNVQIPGPEEQFDIVEEMYFIEKIQTEKEQVTFVRRSGSHILEQIIVKNLYNNEEIVIDFTYDEEGQHRLLTQLAVNGKEYEFEYYDAPADMSDAYPDQWGYYKYPFTGSEYWGLYLHEEFKDHYFSESEQTSANTRFIYQIKDRLNYILPCFVNRETNDNPHYFSLKKVIYPTKGSTTYEYEPNRYNKSWPYNPAGPVINGCGQRIKKITSQAAPGANSLVTVYKYGVNEDGNGKVDADYMTNIKYRFFNETYAYDLTTYDQPGTGYRWYTATTSRTYSPNAMDGDIDLSSPVEYEQVTAYQYDEGNDVYNGKTVSNFSVPSKYTLTTMNRPTQTHGVLTNETPRRYLSSYLLGKDAALASRLYYNQADQLLKKEEFVNEWLSTPTYYGVKAKQRIFLDVYPGAGTSALRSSVEDLMDGYFDYGTMYTQLYSSRPLSKTTTEYDGASPLITTETYEYNAKSQLSKTSVSNSVSGSISKEFTYPTAGLGTIYGTMESRNMVSPVISVITKNNGLEVHRMRTNYTDNAGITTGLLLPLSVETSYSGASGFRSDLVYDKYDSKGNILQYVGPDGIKNSFVWGYNQKLPIAGTVNASVSDIFFTSFEDGEGNSSVGDAKTGLKSRTGGYSKSLSGLSNGNYRLSYWLKSGGNWSLQSATVTVSSGSYTISISGQLDELRFYPEAAQMTSFTYNPAKGTTSQSDLNNNISYYEYDVFGRLSLVRDQDGNILKKICYNYFGQPEDCGAPLFYSVVKSGNFTRNNCGAGYNGGSVTYTVPAGTYSSAADQATADALAQADVDANGQTYANTNGTCTLIPVYARLEYQNIFYDLAMTTADLVLKFYSDAACTIPYSVTNLNVNYSGVRTNCGGGSPTTFNYTAYNCSGTSVVVATDEILMEYDALHCWEWVYSTTAGVGYFVP